jgi:predicted lactoylglutathione lyase
MTKCQKLNCNLVFNMVNCEAQDHGWMYQRSFADLDGHQWEIIWMDMNKMPQV